MKYNKLTKEEEMIAKEIVDAAFIVHKRLGPGLLEKVYEACFCHELKKKGLKFKRQVDVPIEYDDMVFDEGLRLDVIVKDKNVKNKVLIQIVNKALNSNKNIIFNFVPSCE